jgi:imidazolonepropionase-like amidohydrolase
MAMFALRAPQAFDGDAFVGGVTVLVDEGRIAGIEHFGYEVPSDCPATNHDGATLLPGLIDTHSHLVADGGVGALDRVAGYDEPALDEVITAALQATLASGVTTVRDLGDRSFAVADRRDTQRRTDDRLPWIVASGPPITTPGGHCCYLGGEVRSAADIHLAVAERIERRVDVVKVMASGGVNTPGSDMFRPQFSTGDLSLVVDLAHAAGLPVAVHAHAADAVDQAVEVGADTIEHASYLADRGDALNPARQGLAGLTSAAATDEQLERLAASGVLVCPTLGGFTAEMIRNGPAHVVQMLREAGITAEEIVAARLSLVSRMGKVGVRFVGGMDSGIAPPKAHGRYAEAVLALADGIGALASLTASTRTAAEVCGLGRRKGRLANGYDADLLVVDGDLRRDLTALRVVRQVVLRGEPVG